jgi:hypothetical protein
MRIEVYEVPRDFSNCWGFHLNKFPAASGIFWIPAIQGIAEISIKMSFLRHRGCLGFWGFSDCRDFHMDELFVALEMLGIPGMLRIAGICT